MPDRKPRLRSRLVWSTALALGSLVGAALLVPSWGGDGGEQSKSLVEAYRPGDEVAPVQRGGRQDQERDLPRRRARRHRGPDDPGAAGPLGGRRRGPAQRARPDADPDPAAGRPRRRRRRTATSWRAAATRSRAPTGSGWCGRGAATPPRAPRASQAEPFHFQATDLGSYLLWDAEQEFVAGDGNLLVPSVVSAADANARAIWAVQKSGDGFTFTNDAGGLKSGDAARLRHRQPLRPAPHRRLRGVAGDHRQHLRAHLRRHLLVPGGARHHRRAHPRHGVRVPRRRRPLRQAVVAVRRDRRPRRLPRPLHDPGLRRRPRGRSSAASPRTTRSAGRRSRTGRRPTR